MVQFNPKQPSKRTVNEQMVVGFGVRETEEADMWGKSIVWVEGLESILGENSTPSDFLKETLDFRRN